MNIFNISAKESFVDVLAEHFLQRYKDKPDEFSKVLFLLPNRRACQNLAEAFVKLRGMKPTILPRMAPIADVEEDEIFLSGNKEIMQKIMPAVDNTERVLIFTYMIMQIPDISLSQAYALAENLASFFDMVQNTPQYEESGFANLNDIVPETYAIHWQKTLELLKIITEYWPQKLAENGLCDPMERRKQLLRAEFEYWQNSPNRPKIVVAGSTAAFPVLKEAVKTIAGFDNGEVYLYGLDKYLDDSSWQSMDENHPQYELKELLDYLEISRDSIPNLNGETISIREKLVSEIMRPAATSAAWRKLSPEIFSQESFNNIKLVDCDDLRQEAKAIALIMRQALEEKEKTIALVTYDCNLSRRVVSELKKWNINADDSAGQPLSLTPIGIYLRLIGEAVAENTDTAKFALMKYPFTACGMKRGKFKYFVDSMERNIRYPYDCVKTDDEQDNISVEFIERSMCKYSDRNKLTDEQKKIFDDFEARLRPLKDMYENPRVDLYEMLKTHIKVAESLADTDSKTGEKIIWQRDDGRIAAEFFAEFIKKGKRIVDEYMTKSKITGNIATNDYLPFLTMVLSEQNVRLRYGFHPRIKILGPIEARLNHYDTVIIGEVNEGIWPHTAKADMWLSRPMKESLGLPQNERNIGVCAADFAHLMNADKVYLTRAQKVDGAPTDKSRWWLRFETVLGAIFGGKRENKNEDKREYYSFIYQQPFSEWAKNLERCDKPEAIGAPEPRPKLKYRPRKLSASKVEILMRDPYSIYAEYILKLKALNDLDRKKEVYDFGNIVHRMLEKFNDKYNGKEYPEDAAEQLMALGLQEFCANGVGEEVAAFWRPRLKAMIEVVMRQEKICRSNVEDVFNEVVGEVELKGKQNTFSITAKADRINKNTDGTLCIIEYKTGRGREAQSIEDCTSPQLPVEALIAQYAGYKKERKDKPPVIVAPGTVSGMQYWALKGESEGIDADKSQKAIEGIQEVLQKLIDIFDDESRAYRAKPIQIPKKRGQYNNYDHLSRFLEWSVKDDDNNEEDDGE